MGARINPFLSCSRAPRFNFGVQYKYSLYTFLEANLHFLILTL